MTAEPLGTVENVSREVGGRRILAPVSFGLPVGGCVALRGANGSGKTTLLHILLGRDEPSTGTVRFTDSLDVRTFAAVTGLPPFYENLTVAEHLDFIRITWDMRVEAESAELLERLGAAHIAHSFPDELSSGERQLLALAAMQLRQLQETATPTPGRHAMP